MSNSEHLCSKSFSKMTAKKNAEYKCIKCLTKSASPVNTVFLIPFTLILTIPCFVMPVNSHPGPLKYGNMEYDKDMLESVLKEVINDEITKMNGPNSGVVANKQQSTGGSAAARVGVEDQRSSPDVRFTDSSSQRQQSTLVGVDDYLERFTSSDSINSNRYSQHQQQQASSDQQALRPSQNDEYPERQPLRVKETADGPAYGYPGSGNAQNNNNYRDLQQEVALLEEKLRVEKMMRQKLEQQDARLREEKMLQERLREERKRVESLLAEEAKLKHGNSDLRKQKHRQEDDLAVSAFNDEMNESGDSDRILKPFSESGLKVVDPEDITIKSLTSLSSSESAGGSSKYFPSELSLEPESLSGAGLSLRPSSLLSSQSLLHPKSHHPYHHSASRPPNMSFGMPGMTAYPQSFGSAHAASTFSPAFSPKFMAPAFMPGVMPGSGLRRPIPVGPMGIPFGSRPLMPGFPSPMTPYAAASSLSPAAVRYPAGHPALHSIAAQMYPTLYASNPNSRSSSSSSASATASSTGSRTEVSEKKDPRSKKIKSMLMDFAVSSILDVGMMGLVGNILSKVNGDSASTTRRISS